MGRNMKVELHLHTDRYSPCARSTPEEMIFWLAAAGYEAVYITEHDAVWTDGELASLQIKFPQVRIFPGVELTLPGDDLQHLLVLGTNDPAFLLLKAPQDILAAARSQGHLTILAHPLRKLRGAPMLEAGLMPDALEHRTGNQGPYRGQIVEKMGSQLGVPLVNTSDAHNPEALDQFWIETYRPLLRADDIRDIVLSGAYECFVQEPVPAVSV